MRSLNEYSVQEVSEMLKSDSPPLLVDVRQPAEWDLVRLEGARLLTEELAGEILEEWNPDTNIVCYCHHGVRSAQAAMYFASKGFSNVSSMRGGIDVWALEVDPSLPRY